MRRSLDGSRGAARRGRLQKLLLPVFICHAAPPYTDVCAYPKRRGQDDSERSYPCCFSDHDDAGYWLHLECISLEIFTIPELPFACIACHNKTVCHAAVEIVHLYVYVLYLTLDHFDAVIYADLSL